MNRTIDRVKILFLGVFLLISAGMFAYQAYFVWPRERCEASGAWWDPKDRLCATPMPIWRITGRLPDRVATPRQDAPAASAPAPAPVKP